MNAKDRVVILFLMPFNAITFIVFGCCMAKFHNAFYLGLTSVLTGIFWFNWALFEKHKRMVKLD